jgi:hypothetical protein
MMAQNHFQQQIEAFDRWKRQLIGAIEDFQQWLDRHQMENGEHSLRVFEALEALRNDRLNIAFVAEFSRGKTELINAIFFADYQRRLLPSEAGRTTMCPTELFYDRATDSAYVRLLPIETRTEETSIAEYRHDPVYWTTIPLDLSAPEQMEEALHEVIRTKTVSVDEATRLGLYTEENYPQVGDDAKEATEVEIPMWRHALISFPHPLLKQGLVILDTPGLNALGSEPELTMNMLPSAQAVLFVLAADTGVTRSDLDVWQYHIDGTRRSRRQKGIAVVLNKIDTMWDELRNNEKIADSVASQVRKTAAMLGVDPGTIFPVSAQKGLLAKIRGDHELLDKSRIATLENYLSSEVLPARESILRDTMMRDLGQLLDEQQQVLQTRIGHTTSQHKELRNLSGKNADVILHLMKKTREEQTTYQKNVDSFQASRRLLQRQGAALLDYLSLESIDKLIADTRRSMLGSWTTSGLKRGMKTFFDGARETMDRSLEQAEQTCKLVTAIYKKFHVEHGLPAIKPRLFSVDEYSRQMDELYEEAEAFRKSPVTTMTEQNFVIKKFFISLVSQARSVYFHAHQEAETWLREVMNPLIAQIKEHRNMMERRLKTLRKINESRDTLDSKLVELEQETEQLQKQLDTLISIRERLTQPPPFDTSSAA